MKQKPKIDGRHYGKLKRQKDFLITFEKSAGNITQACKACGIARDTFYLWYNFEYANGKDNPFRDKVDEIKEGLLDLAESKLMQRINGFQANETRKKTVDGELTEEIETIKRIAPDPTSIIFFLKTKGKGRGYIETVHNENVNINKNYDFAQKLEDCTDDELDKLANDLEDIDGG